MNGEHATTVNGKGKGIGLDDLVSVGVKAGLSKSSARTIADEVRQADGGTAISSHTITSMITLYTPSSTSISSK